MAERSRRIVRAVVCGVLTLAVFSPVLRGFTVTYHAVAFNSVDDSWLSSPCHALTSPPYYTALTATASSHGTDESFELADLNGGNLVDGDEVAIVCDGQNGHDGYGLSVSSGETPVRFDEPVPGSGSSTWYLYDNDCLSSGCIVQSGDKLGFQNKATGKYLYASAGGGGNVNADSYSPGIYGRFEIVF